ncbi:MAG: ATP phosphoribosyltransferase [uncultured bacterium]|nr:MAG: ATP phosphoribosyltransferase [uncultured bacterium]
MIMSTLPTRIAVQSSGRLRDDSLTFLQSLGIQLPSQVGRLLLVSAVNCPVEVVFVRHRDIPRYVQTGVVHYGIVGENVLNESAADVIQLQRLAFGNCRLVIAVPKNSGIDTVCGLSGLRIATSYPNSLKKFLRQSNIAAEVVTVDGSVEVAPQLDLADAVCDLTQTGITLRTHDLVPIQTLFESQAVFITTPL